MTPIEEDLNAALRELADAGEDLVETLTNEGIANQLLSDRYAAAQERARQVLIRSERG